MADEKKPESDREIFEFFFRENCCEPEYRDVQGDFERLLAEMDLYYFFAEDTDLRTLTRKNFITCMSLEAYEEFEALVEEACDSMNSEILDAVMDISASRKDAGEVTEAYWEKNEELLKKFLRQLYDDKLADRIRQEIREEDDAGPL